MNIDYHYIKQLKDNRKYKTIIFDPGIFQTHGFFDNDGFNYDSSSYSPEFWDRELTLEEKDYINNYIFNLKIVKLLRIMAEEKQDVSYVNLMDLEIK